jgi:lipopolysaccharide exporter
MKASTLIKSGLWISYATFVTRIFAFLSSLILARLLQPADFGVIGIAYIFWSFFTLFTQDTAGTFIIYKGIENSKYVNTAYTISLLVGLSFGLGIVAISPFVASFFSEPALTGILIAFAFNLVLSSLGYVYSGVMTRQMKYRVMANISLAASIARLLCTIVSALCGLSYWSFVIGDTASWILNCVLSKHYSEHQFRFQIDPEVKSEVLSFYFGSIGSSFGLYTNFNIDNFTVGKLLGSTSLGYYNLAYQITTALSTIFSAVLTQLGMPIFAQLSDDQQQQNALLKVVEKTALLVAPIYALIFLIFDEKIVTLVFGANWIPICQVIPGLLFFSYFRIINSPLYSMMVAKGRPEINAKVNLHIAPVAVISFVIGAYQGGIFGVSLAVAIVLGFGWTIYWWWVACRTLVWSLKKFLFPCLIPIFLIVPDIVISQTLPLLIRPFALLLTYLVSVKLFLPRDFYQYQTRLYQFANRLITSYHSR